MLKNSYHQFWKTVENKLIVLFGVGKMFHSYKYFLEESNLQEKILAVVDNDVLKYGTEIEIHAKVYTVISFMDLINLHADCEFVIVVTAACFDEIRSQIKGCKNLCDIEVVDARYVLQRREDFVASYSNIFRETTPEVGENGENLTVSILMHNRAQLTNRLIESIQEHMPHFRGEILIGDNGSDVEECRQVKEKLERMNFRWTMVNSDRHYPIPAGKNRLNMQCRTEWIMQLDNDIYFIDNPLKKVNEDIARLGCPIWGFPYYNAEAGKIYNYGSNLEFVKNERGEKMLVCLNDLQFQESRDIWEPMLCTYTSGGASLMRKSFFDRMGGYDENIYVHEDIELAYRINMAGYKIGNIGMKCLVHDHKQIDSELGHQYEAMRFDAQKIKESKKYLYLKHGFIFA